MSIWTTISNFLHRKLDGYTVEEYLIMFVVSCIFLPFYCSIIAIILTLLYLAYKKRIPDIIRQYSKSKYAIIFCVLIGAVSLYHGNQLGALCSLGILVIFLFVIFYRTTITPRLFELIIDACCIVSLFCFVWAMMEYYSIVQSLDYNFFDLIVEDDPVYRISSTFFNANYYAMMLEFFIIMCIYKMMKVTSKRRIVFYVVTISCNMLTLYLSGCRTAWIPLVVTIPLMFLINNHKRFFAITVLIIAFVGCMFLMGKDIFPRNDSFGISFETRMDIWMCGIRGFLDHPLFGQGPLTYFQTYMEYGGPYTQHAHSIYIDPFMSFGVVGVFLLARFMLNEAREIWHLYSQKLNMRLFSLVLCFILIIMIHGILDYTIFWIQTSLTFFLIYFAPSMYSNGRINDHKGAKG